MQPDEKMPPWAQLILDQQRRTATSVGNLSLGLSAHANRLQSQHDQIVGILLADVSEKREQRKRHDSGDDTNKFKFPSGDSIELTRRSQKRIVQGVLLGVLWVLSHVVQYFLTHPAPGQMGLPMPRHERPQREEREHSGEREGEPSNPSP